MAEPKSRPPRFEQFYSLVCDSELSSGALLSVLAKVAGDLFNLDSFPCSSSGEHKVDDGVRHLLTELGQKLRVDVRQATELFASFCLSQLGASDRVVEEAASGGAELRQTLLNRLDRFYKSEQLYRYRCIGALLKRITVEDDIEAKEKLLKFVTDSLKGGEFLSKLCAELKKLAQTVPQSSEVAGSTVNYEMTRLVMQKQATHLLQLQIEVAKVILWYQQLFDHAGNDLLCCLSTLAQLKFGDCQKSLSAVDIKEVEVLQSSLRHLLVLVAVQLFQIDMYLASSLDTSNAQQMPQIVWSNEQNLKELENKLKSLPADRTTAPIKMAEAVLFGLLAKPDLENTIAHLGFQARESDVCGSLSDMLTDRIIEDDEDISCLAKTIVYSLLDGFVSLFEADSLKSSGSDNDLNSVLALVVNESTLAADVWARNFDAGASRHVRDEMFRFPSNLPAALQLVKALCVASEDSCKRTVGLLQRLPFFCESANLVARSAIKEVDNDDETTTVVQLAERRLPYGDAVNGFAIPAGSMGQMINCQGSSFIQWQHFYSGWQVCLLEVEAAAAAGDCSDFGKLKSILELVALVLRQNGAPAGHMAHFLTAALKLMRSSVGFAELLPVCLDCFAQASRSHPVEMLVKLSQIGALPDYVEGERIQSGGSSKLGFICEVIADANADEPYRRGLRLDTTVALLDLISHLVNNSNAVCRSPCIGLVQFLLDYLMCSYQGWSYGAGDHRKRKEDITEKLLSVVQQLLMRVAIDGGQTIGTAAALCVDGFLNGPASWSLLDLVAVGLEPLNLLFESQPGSRQTSRILKLVLRSLSVLSTLLDVAQQNRNVILTESALVQQLYSPLDSPVGMQSHISIISEYVLFRFDVRLSKMALICLTKLAEILPATLLSSIGERTVELLCSAVPLRLSSPTEDTQLKIYLLQFLTALVGNQPALAERMFDEKNADEAEQQQASANSVAGAVRRLLEAESQVPQLTLAVYQLLLTLRQRRQTAAVDKLIGPERRRFYVTLSAPLLEGESSFYLKLVAPVLRILAQQLQEDVVKEVVIDGKVLEKERLDLLFSKMTDLLKSKIAVGQKVDVLEAWSLFLVAVAEEHTLAKDCGRILEQHCEILCLIFNEMSSPEDDFVQVKAFGHSLDVLFREWISEVTNPERLSKSMLGILCGISDKLPPYVIPAAGDLFVGILKKFVRHASAETDGEEFISPLLLPTVHILEKLFVLYFNSLSDDCNSNAFRIIQRSTAMWLCLLDQLVAVAQPEHWSALLKKHSVVRNLVVMLVGQTKKCHFGAELQLVCLELWARCVAPAAAAFDLVLYSGCFDYVNIELYEVLSRRAGPLFGADGSDQSKAEHKVFQALVRFVGAGLSAPRLSARREFIRFALDFVGCYEALILQTLNNSLVMECQSNLMSAMALVRTLISLAEYAASWKKDIPDNFSAILTSVSYLSNGLVRALSRPNLLLSRQRVKSDTGGQLEDRVGKIQKHLLETLVLTVRFLLRFSPPLSAVCNDEVSDMTSLYIQDFDADAHDTLLALDFSSFTSALTQEAVGPKFLNEPLSFGILTTAVQLCVGAMRKSDTARTASPSAKLAGFSFPLVEDRTLTKLLFEMSIDLLLSQTALYLRRSELDQSQRHTVKREITSELGTLLSRCVRFAGGASPLAQRRSNALTPTTATSSTSSFDYNFVKFASDFVHSLAAGGT